jgi:hypothetical protein
MNALAINLSRIPSILDLFQRLYVLGTAFALSLSQWLFNGAAAPTLASTVQIRLYTADPGVGGAVGTNETTYTNYVALTRTRTDATQFTCAAKTIATVADLVFAVPGSTAAAITHAALIDTVGNRIMAIGTITPNLAVSNGGSAPTVPAGTFFTWV